MDILFDIGGTNIRIAGAKNASSFLAPKIFKTPKIFKEVVDLIVSEAKKIAGLDKITSVIGAVSGSIDKSGIVLKSRNLKQLEHKPFARNISRRLRAKVLLVNDAVMAGLGECSFGAGKSSKICAYITISTGIGGARFTGGEVDKYNLSFEPGKQLIKELNGKFLSWEDLASGKAIQDKFNVLPSNVKDKKFWEKEAKIVAVGLYNTIMHWTPDTLVLGGGIILTTPLSIQLTEKELKKINSGYAHKLPKIKKARLGDFGGLWGGLAWLKLSK